jgi:hypothetical protein
MHRLAVAALALVLLITAPALATVAIGGQPRGLIGLTAAGGSAYAIVHTRDHSLPFAIVRTGGRSRSVAQPFGEPGAEFPDVAAGPNDSVLVSWGRPISNGDLLIISTAPSTSAARFGASELLASGTGPGRLAIDPAGQPVVAYPDGDGDAAFTRGSGPQERLTATAPELRHLPLDVALDPAGAVFMVDLVQSRTRSELRLLGPGAPTAPIAALPGLEDMSATLAIDAGRAYVGYGRNGRVHLAIAALQPSARWFDRRLPGRGGSTGAPAVLRTSNSTFVVYTQRRLHGRGDVYLATEGPGPLKVRRITATTADERIPFAAAGPGGEVFAGWSRGRDLRGSATAVVTRLR